MSDSWITEFRVQIIEAYHSQKEMADQAIARTDEHAFFTTVLNGTGANEPDDNHINSIAILVKHISGNFRSRWTDFLTTDGEKPDRQREQEFAAEENENRTAILARWQEGWQILFATLDALQPQDFSRTVTIRDETHSVIQAIVRNLLHATHHIGQIDLLATALRKN
ncbi:MAG: DUF1572 domain-containing protein [Chloroflexota bacterium]|nr:DUF1572 domain-containing protein [Chloroflexota bacterium]